MKALIKGVYNQERNWAWHHLEHGQAPKTEKAPLGLKLVWSIPWQKFFQFQSCFQTTGKKAFF